MTRRPRQDEVGHEKHGHEDDGQEETAQEETTMEQLTQHDFQELPLDRLETRTGLEAPQNPSPEEEEAYREKAWNSYRVDVENRDELGTAAQSTSLPAGEEPDL